MSGKLAIGLGCRKGCGPEPVIRLVQTALAELHRHGSPVTLFTIAHKQGEVGLHQAALQLGLELHFLQPDRLKAMADQVVTRSARVEERFGLPGIAEAAALAGAGSGARLLLRRISADGVTCAVASAEEQT